MIKCGKINFAFLQFAVPKYKVFKIIILKELELLHVYITLIPVDFFINLCIFMFMKI